ncbi:putative Rep protein [Circovirus-like genome RW-D]|uniref:putative Rep protein n=1 Tax=Circovirus-like genome RW-D TaxID=642254 RepID=UPI0001AE5DB9|nr:putative Rep protein [Circovirus-like genome RW-D]ACQ78163.1 putative Rep protein [Circovirus-like genome RW-D]
MLAQAPGRYRNWVITVNNWTENDYKLALLSPYRYIIIGRERGECNTPHLQIYLQLYHAKSFDTVKQNFFPRAHLEASHSKPRQARAYCTKEHYFEYGEMSTQGKRTDLQVAQELLDSGISIRQALESEMITSMGALAAYEKLQKYYTVHRPRPRVVWIYGPAGSGKTDKAYSISGPDVYKSDLIKEGWFDGYDRHRSIIIDDLEIDRDDKKTFGLLLSLLDKNPQKVNVKGSSASILADTIVITCQQAPWHIWYHPSDNMSLPFKHMATREEIERDVDLRQIMRRITEIIHLTDTDKVKYPEVTEV